MLTLYTLSRLVETLPIGISCKSCQCPPRALIRLRPRSLTCTEIRYGLRESTAPQWAIAQVRWICRRRRVHAPLSCEQVDSLVHVEEPLYRVARVDALDGLITGRDNIER